MQNPDLGLGASLRADWSRNRGNEKALLIVSAYRVGQAFHRLRVRLPSVIPLFFAYRVAYTLLTEWLLGIEIKLSTRIGPGLKLEHCMGLVVNRNSVIGADCTLRHNTTIGEKPDPSGILAAPVLGDGVDVGANVVIIGGIRVGHLATVGAGAVVTRDVPEGAIVVGNPARILGGGDEVHGTFLRPTHLSPENHGQAGLNSGKPSSRPLESHEIS